MDKSLGAISCDMISHKLAGRFPKVDKPAGIVDSDWDDWKWQVRNILRTPEAIAERFSLSNDHKNWIRAAERRFLAGMTPYYASLIEKVDDPIGLQAIPQKEELDFNEDEYADPLSEERYSPQRLIVHKYPDRLLLYASNICATYCRHCTRKQKNFDSCQPAGKDLEDAIGYIRDRIEIRDVVISGGDPLLLEDSMLEGILTEISLISHVEIIRIHTRTPVTLPQRITEDLMSILKKHSPLYVNTHFNHPRECTYESYVASERLRDAGCILGNQMVLLKGVNDDPQIVEELNHKLLMMGIKPYYIFHCDKNLGNTHLRTSLETGLGIIRHLGRTSGLAVPHYIMDSRYGKINLGPDDIVGKDGSKYLLRTRDGGIYPYEE